MTTSRIEAIIASWVPTDRLARLALTVYSRDGATPLWQGIAADPTEAAAYYASLGEVQLRSEAAEILAAGGWTVTQINRRLS